MKIFFILYVVLIGSVQASIICADDIKTKQYKDHEQILVDKLFKESMLYLEGFVKTLKTPQAHCDSALARRHTKENHEHATTCIHHFQDVSLLLEQTTFIINNSEQAKKCFDPQRDYKKMKLFTPNIYMQEKSEIARWLNRPLLTDYFAAHAEKEVQQAGEALHKNFELIIHQVTAKHLRTDITMHHLYDLWSSVGWIPFYAERQEAINPRFRGGYAYAEVIGPWGMLRIDKVNDQPFGLELGMTVQLSDTFYPYHYHHPQEIYIPLSNENCIKQYEYSILESDDNSLQHSAHIQGKNITISSEQWKNISYPYQLYPLEVSYLTRNAIHAFYLKNTCFETQPISALVNIWARTTAHEYDQTTRLCHLIEDHAKGRPGLADPNDHYNCHLYNLNSK